MVEVALRAVRVDLQSRTPVLVLQETGALRRSIPIFIGEPEAVAIECAVRGVPAPRPLTHDLLRDVITSSVRRSRASSSPSCARRPTTPSCTSRPSTGDMVVSARPSDAVALALRTESPLFVDDELMDDEGRMIELADEDEDERRRRRSGDVDELAEQFRDFLDTVHPEDFQQ